LAVQKLESSNRSELITSHHSFEWLFASWGLRPPKATSVMA
jgi:hypothetical protein